MFFFGEDKIFKVFKTMKTGSSWFNPDDVEVDGTATMVPRRELVNTIKVHQVSFNFYESFNLFLVHFHLWKKMHLLFLFFHSSENSE